MAFITHDGKLLVMGSDDYGKLGLGEMEEVKDEHEHRGFRGRYAKSENRLHTKSAQTSSRMGFVDVKKVTQVSCGVQHTACLTEDGEVMTWGLGKFGALGHKDIESTNVPKKVEGLSNIIKI